MFYLLIGSIILVVISAVLAKRSVVRVLNIISLIIMGVVLYWNIWNWLNLFQ